MGYRGQAKFTYTPLLAHRPTALPVYTRTQVRRHGSIPPYNTYNMYYTARLMFTVSVNVCVPVDGRLVIQGHLEAAINCAPFRHQNQFSARSELSKTGGVAPYSPRGSPGRVCGSRCESSMAGMTGT